MMWSKLLLFTFIIILLVWGAAIADNLIGPLGFSVIAYAGLIFLALSFRDRDGIYADTGRHLPSALGLGIILGAVLIAVVFVVELWLNMASVDGLEPSWLTVLGSGILIQVVVCVGEELPFRGYIVPLIAGFAGRTWAIVGSSVIFSTAHLVTILFQGASPEHTVIMMTSIFFGGVILAIIYLKYGLAAAMGFHFSWNLLQYSVFGLTAQDAALVVTTSGDPLITGGTLGPEAGLLGLAVLSLGTVVLFVVNRGSRA